MIVGIKAAFIRILRSSFAELASQSSRSWARVALWADRFTEAHRRPRNAKPGGMRGLLHQDALMQGKKGRD